MNQSKGIKITQLFHKGRKNTKKEQVVKKIDLNRILAIIILNVIN